MSSNKVVDYDLENHLEKSIKEAALHQEPEDINSQKELFSKWNEHRKDLIAEQIANFKLKQKKESLGKRLLDLQNQEEKLRYFEEEGKIALEIKRASQIRPIDDLFKTD